MVQKLVNLIYIKKITNQKLVMVCQGDSHIYILGKSSYPKVCIDLCNHYEFCHKMTTLVTLFSNL